MSNPSNPNYKAGVGRLATDRFDFQKHVDGYSFRHNATTIDLSPSVSVPGQGTQTNVQSAIEKISLVIASSGTIVVDATTTDKGIVKLAGDIGGTATIVRVTKIQGFPVVSTPPTNNQVLTWNGSAWAPTTQTSSFTATGDLGGSNTSQTVIGIRGRPMSATAPTNNQVISWNGSTWLPTTIMPTGTGFATTTSGAFDTASTSNIRYTSGKFQTDTNIQFKNSTITGDLAWAPTTSNKTLTLPDITDVLVTRTNTETLTNKTISLNNNTLTTASIATGDLIKGSGSSFARFAKGTALQLLRVNSGATDLEWFTPKWTQGAYSVTLSSSITMSATDEANEILYFGGTGGTYTITVPNPATDADAHTHYVEVGPGLTLVFTTGAGTTYSVTTTGATKRGIMAVCNNKITGNLA